MGQQYEKLNKTANEYTVKAEKEMNFSPILKSHAINEKALREWCNLKN